MRSFEAALALALALVAAALFAMLLLLNRWHRRQDARTARLRDVLRPMLVDWAERDPTTAELHWLERLPRGDARIVLVACLEVLPDGRGFATTREDFAGWVEGRKRLLMEDFYRWQRVRLDVLMEGAEPVGSTPEQFAAYIASEVAKWDRVVKQAKIPPVQ